MDDKKLRDVALTIVGAILDEMLGRRGFRQLWDDLDDETREEIVEAWRARVVSAMLAHDYELASGDDSES